MTLLPWQGQTMPLMLAPMQGLTNRAMRAVQCEIGQPDVIFTEFVRVSHVARKRIAPSDRREIQASYGGVPLVVQLIGHRPESLAEAARIVADLGGVHVNLNMGCPFGRTTTGKTGGAMLQEPERIEESLRAVRAVFQGSLSVKVRAGYHDPEQIFDLLPVFEDCGVDFLVLHPRTVVQKYTGQADHDITARVVAATALPVIANGDLFTAEYARRVAVETGAAGLMLGRGAISDPWLFERIRHGGDPGDLVEQLRQMSFYFSRLSEGYSELFCGEQQVLCKVKNVLEAFVDPDMQPLVKKLRRTKQLAQFHAVLRDAAQAD